MENNIVTKNGSSNITEPQKIMRAIVTDKSTIALPGAGSRRVRSSTKVITLILLALLLPVSGYYLWTRGFVYLNYSREIYTDYFWFRAPWLLIHVVCGLVATLIGPLQFLRVVRKKYPTLHRTLGKVYFGCIILSTLVSFYLVSTAQLGGPVYVIGLGSLGVVWLTSTSMAYFSIRKGNLQMHREWMVKSYVLTVAFVSFRFIEDLLALVDFSNFVERKVLMSWACWAIPFFVTEVILQAQKLRRGKLTV